MVNKHHLRADFGLIIVLSTLLVLTEWNNITYFSSSNSF